MELPAGDMVIGVGDSGGTEGTGGGCSGDDVDDENRFIDNR